MKLKELWGYVKYIFLCLIIIFCILCLFYQRYTQLNINDVLKIDDISNINRLSFMVTSENNSVDVPKALSDDEISTIKQILGKARFRYQGVYSSIEYGDLAGGDIVSIVYSGNKIFHIKKNGEVYSENDKYFCTGNEIREVFDLLNKD